VEPVVKDSEGIVAGRKRPKRVDKKRNRHSRSDHSDNSTDQEARNSAADMTKDSLCV